MMKKRFLALLLAAVCLLTGCSFIGGAPAAYSSPVLDKAFASGDILLERLDLPGTDEVTWLSVSPRGSYLMGRNEDGFVMYDMAKQRLYPVTVDYHGDNGNVEKVMRSLRAYRECDIVWAPDESAFTLTYYEATVVNVRYEYGSLLLGDPRKGTLQILQTWNPDYRKDGFGAVLQACFSPSGRQLYLTLASTEHARAGDGTIIVAMYDLGSGRISRLFGANYRTEDGTLFAFYGRNTLRCLDDGSLVMLFSGGGNYFVRHCYQSSGRWQEQLLQIGRSGGGARLLSTHGSGLCAIAYNYYEFTDTTDGAYTLIASQDQSGELRPLMQLYHRSAWNVVFSPDGKYMLRLDRNDEALYVDRLADNASVRVSVPFRIDQSACTLLCGDNPIAGDFQDGMQWGGDILLLNSKAGPIPYVIR